MTDKTEEILEQTAQNVTKAIFESSDLSSGGLLNPEQANNFLDRIHDYAVISKEARNVRMNSPKRLIEKIGFNNRILQVPQAQGTAPMAGEIVEPTTTKLELSTVEVAAYVDLGFDTVEDNIERGGLENHIINLVTTRIATDLEELYLKGDTGSGDPFLALLDGWFVQATTNVYDHASAAFSEDAVFGSMLDKLPNKYQRNMDGFRFYVTPKVERAIRRERAARATVGGDGWLTTKAPLVWSGVPIEGVPLISEAASATGNVLLVHPQNIVVGVHRDVSYDNFRNGRLRVWQMTWTMRVDTKYEFEDAVVVGQNVVA